MKQRIFIRQIFGNFKTDIQTKFVKFLHDINIMSFCVKLNISKCMHCRHHAPVYMTYSRVMVVWYVEICYDVIIEETNKGM